MVLSAEGQALILEACLAGSGLVLKSSSYNQLYCWSGHIKNLFSFDISLYMFTNKYTF